VGRGSGVPECVAAFATSGTPPRGCSRGEVSPSAARRRRGPTPTDDSRHADFARGSAPRTSGPHPGGSWRTRCGQDARGPHRARTSPPRDRTREVGGGSDAGRMPAVHIGLERVLHGTAPGRFVADPMRAGCPRITSGSNESSTLPRAERRGGVGLRAELEVRWGWSEARRTEAWRRLDERRLDRRAATFVASRTPPHPRRELRSRRDLSRSSRGSSRERWRAPA